MDLKQQIHNKIEDIKKYIQILHTHPEFNKQVNVLGKALPFREVIKILEQSIEICENLGDKELFFLSWYHQNNFSNISALHLHNSLGSLGNILSTLLNDISSHLQKITTTGAIDNTTANSLIFATLRLFTILKDFRFDLDDKEFEKRLEKSETLLREMDWILEEVKSQRHELEVFFNNAKNEINRKLTSLDEYEREQKRKLENLISKAKETLEWTKASGMKDAYAKRVKGLRFEVIFYFSFFVISAFATLFISFSAIFYPKAFFELINLLPFIEINVPKSEGIIELPGGLNAYLLRSSIVIPFLVITFLFWRTFSNLRRLMEEYKLREVLAQNIMFGVKYLTEDLNFDKEFAFREYVKPSIQMILSNPIESSFAKVKFGRDLKNTTFKKLEQKDKEEGEK